MTKCSSRAIFMICSNPGGLAPPPTFHLALRFRAGGLLEMARHLMTWGLSVRIVEGA
jgi:hypothetical protein